MVADCAGKCDVLIKQFTIVFFNEDCSHIPPSVQWHHGDPLSIITVEAVDVAKDHIPEREFCTRSAEVHSSFPERARRLDILAIVYHL